MFAKRTRRINATRRKTENRQIIAAATDGSLYYIPSNAQHIGARGNQEDAFAFSDLSSEEIIKKQGFLTVVADGMGGLAFGEEASRAAVAAFIKEYGAGPDEDSIDNRMMRAISAANAAVYDLAFSAGKEIDLGTTVVAAAIHNNCLHWISAGDSRIYLFRDQQLQKLTIDHIYANHLQTDVDTGKITQKEADLHPERSFLTSYLGLLQLPEVSKNNGPLLLHAEDKIILCTDGLYDTLSMDEIKAVLVSDSNNVAGELVNTALARENPHQDNITVAVLSVFSS